eukprot:GHVP01070351.1.p1 GENE.GHVP01070351.1~~GHVP01070351.1.p1  ORF type:complete len:121 (-),score=20.84 GHVP01070351.1:258-620(-)
MTRIPNPNEISLSFKTTLESSTALDEQFRSQVDLVMKGLGMTAILKNKECADLLMPLLREGPKLQLEVKQFLQTVEDVTKESNASIEDGVSFEFLRIANSTLLGKLSQKKFPRVCTFTRS